MIKKFATMVALLLTVSAIGMVPASASTGCIAGVDEMAVEVNSLDTVWLAVDDDGVVYCDTDNNPFAGGTEVTTGDDDIDSITVVGDGTLVLLLEDGDGDAADWDVINDDFDLEDFDGTLVFDGSTVEDGHLNVRFGTSTVSFSGTTADIDDLEAVEFYDGEESDVFDASALDVPVIVELSAGGHDVAIGGDDEDTFTITGSTDDGVTVRGNGDEDVITDERDDDSCDTVYGGSGNDDIEMAGDCDTVFPGSGNDDVVGATTVSYADVAGAVSILDDGDDSETGLAAGDDEFADAPEVFIGSSYGDTIVATEDGEATLFGGAGNDTIRTANSNKVYGGAGADLLIGSDSTNYLYGNAGADTLRGKRGNDYLFGGAGLDTLYGGRGSDVCGGEVLATCEFIR